MGLGLMDGSEPLGSERLRLPEALPQAAWHRPPPPFPWLPAMDKSIWNGFGLHGRNSGQTRGNRDVPSAGAFWT